jgi:hypothetical protein
MYVASCVALCVGGGGENSLVVLLVNLLVVLVVLEVLVVQGYLLKELVVAPLWNKWRSLTVAFLFLVPLFGGGGRYDKG